MWWPVQISRGHCSWIIRDSSMWQDPVSCFPAYKRGIGLQRGVGKAKRDRQDQRPNQDAAHHCAAHYRTHADSGHRGLPRRQLLSLLICLAVCHTRWSHAGHVGQNSSHNGQDVVKIFCLQKCRVQGKSSGLLPLVSASTQQETEQYGIQPVCQGGIVMKHLVVGSIVLMLITLGWSNRSLGEQVPTPRGELHIVDKDPLNWAYITWNVFEHLVEIDKDGKLVPKLATAWRWLDDRTLEMTLRQGVTFHNGEVFDAEIVKLNWEEYTRL